MLINQSISNLGGLLSPVEWICNGFWQEACFLIMKDHVSHIGIKHRVRSRLARLIRFSPSFTWFVKLLRHTHSKTKKIHLLPKDGFQDCDCCYFQKSVSTRCELAAMYQKDLDKHLRARKMCWRDPSMPTMFHLASVGPGIRLSACGWHRN